MKDYYKLLGLEYAASDEEINFAYKKLMLKYHPDINKDNRNIFNDIMEACKILLNPEKRFTYNLQLIEYYNSIENKGIKRIVYTALRKIKKNKKFLDY